MAVYNFKCLFSYVLCMPIIITTQVEIKACRFAREFASFVHAWI